MYEDILQMMTLEQKIRFCNGADNWSTLTIPGVIDRGISVSDGPHGLRKEVFKGGKKDHTVPATAFAANSLLACSWDRELAYKVAEAMGKETLAAGVQILLGCGVNIKRNPLCGRNMEYFSEDPVLSGEMGAAWMNGLQSTGAGGSLKHFCCNNKEIHRTEYNAIVDERALREIYLKPFEIAVKKGKPATVMTAYNMMNGDYTGEKKSLVTDILRGEWGFEGLVMSDWSAMKDRAKAFEAGEDLEMPHSGDKHIASVMAAVKEGRLSEEKIDECCTRLLRLIDRVYGIEAPQPDLDAHHLLARTEAEESAVLLKNDGNILPLKQGQNICIIGDLARKHPVGGGGSSTVTPYKCESFCNGMDKEGVPYTWHSGFDGKPAAGKVAPEALEAATNSDVTVVLVGSANGQESEGFDRCHMKLTSYHLKLIDALIEKTDNLVVILTSGAPIELPFADRVKAILLLGLSGQAGGAACARVLTGKVNPSGKLTESWPIRYEDVPCAKSFQEDFFEMLYRESIFVGYRYYQTAGRPVRYPFGHGLSYTNFRYSDLAVTDKENTLNISVTVTNIGSVDGKEVVQLYTEKPRTAIPNAKRELVDFEKVFIPAGECRQVHFSVSKDVLRVFFTKEQRWALETGTYVIEVGGSSESLPLRQNISLCGERLKVTVPQWYFEPDGEPSEDTFVRLFGKERFAGMPKRKETQKGQYDRSNFFFELQDASWLCKTVLGIMTKGASSIPGNEGQAMALLHTNLDSLADVMGSGFVDGMLLSANGHSVKGFLNFFKKDKKQKYKVSDFITE